MDSAAPIGRVLAKRILVLESGRDKTPKASAESAVHACEHLRIEMQRLVGVEGYSTLLAYALTLAKAEEAWLESARINPDGSLDWIAESLPEGDPNPLLSGVETLLAHTIQLLITFLGETVTLRLLRNIWPEISLDDLISGTEEKR